MGFFLVAKKRNLSNDGHGNGTNSNKDAGRLGSSAIDLGNGGSGIVGRNNNGGGSVSAGSNNNSGNSIALDSGLVDAANEKVTVNNTALLGVVDLLVQRDLNRNRLKADLGVSNVSRRSSVANLGVVLGVGSVVGNGLLGNLASSAALEIGQRPALVEADDEFRNQRVLLVLKVLDAGNRA